MNAEARDNPSVPVPPPRRCRLRVVGLLVIFASGLAVGWAVSKLLPGSDIKDRNMEGIRDRIVERIDEKVDLTDPQIEQVRKIVEQRLLAWRELRKQIEPEMRVQMEQMNAQITALLNDSQRPKWEQYYAEMLARCQFGTDTQPATQTAPAEN